MSPPQKKKHGKETKEATTFLELGLKGNRKTKDSAAAWKGNSKESSHQKGSALPLGTHKLTGVIVEFGVSIAAVLLALGVSGSNCKG